MTPTTYLRNAASSLTLPERRAQLVAAVAQAERRIRDGERDRAAAEMWLREFEAEFGTQDGMEGAVGRSSASDDADQRTSAEPAVAASDTLLGPNRSRGLSETLRGGGD